MKDRAEKGKGNENEKEGRLYSLSGVFILPSVRAGVFCILIWC